MMRITKAENGYYISKATKTRMEDGGYEYGRSAYVFTSWDDLVTFLKNNPLTDTTEESY